MDAVVALCHFCEVHGPSIVLTTQPFHTSVPNGIPGSVSHGPWGLGTVETQIGSPQDRFSLPWFQGERPLSLETSSSGSGDSFGLGAVASGAGGGNAKKTGVSSSVATTSKADSCEACKAFQTSQQVYYSHDNDSRITYVSSQSPENAKIFSMLRQACVRSLSCEVCPGREGPIFFGQENNQGSHVLSHTFYVKDSLARGFQRFYSIVVLMTDKMFLLNSWPFFVENIRSIIGKIQQSANIIYNLEQSENPQRGARLSQSLRRGGVTTGIRSPRPLSDLIANKLIYKILHMQFTWLLRVGGKRLREKILEGSPLQETMTSLEFDGFSDDDDDNDDGDDVYEIGIAKDFAQLPSADVGEEMTEEGFVKVDLAPSETELFPHSLFDVERDAPQNFTSANNSTPAEKAAYDFEKMNVSTSSPPFVHSQTEVAVVPSFRINKRINPFLTRSADADIVDGDGHDDDDVPEGLDEDLVELKIFTHLRDVIKIIGEDKFHVIAHHVLVGNQVIVQGQPRHLVIGLVDVLQTILPRGCVKAIPYSSVYEDSWKCNFIGLPPDVSLPEHVVDASATHFLWLGVAASSYQLSNHRNSTGNFPQFPLIGTDIEIDILKSVTLPNKAPEILRRMELALFNPNLTNAMVDQCLLCLREEWMNKVKVLFTFTRAGTPSSDETEKLLRVLGSEAQDKEVLKFWMTGLSAQCKQHILSLNSNSI